MVIRFCQALMLAWEGKKQLLSEGRIKTLLKTYEKFVLVSVGIGSYLKFAKKLNTCYL